MNKDNKDAQQYIKYESTETHLTTGKFVENFWKNNNPHILLRSLMKIHYFYIMIFFFFFNSRSAAGEKDTGELKNEMNIPVGQNQNTNLTGDQG